MVSVNDGSAEGIRIFDGRGAAPVQACLIAALQPAIGMNNAGKKGVASSKTVLHCMATMPYHAVLFGRASKFLLDAA